MRIFLSITIPDTVKHELQVIQARLRPRVKQFRWTDASGMHITLKFIGNYPESELGRLETSLQPIADSVSGFELELGGFGVFPSRGSPSVLWMGFTQGEKQLMALAESITVALIQSKIPADHKPFVPHITMGRAKRNLPAFVPDPILPENIVPEHIDIPAANTRFLVKSFYVMESALHSDGAVYTERMEFRLKG